MRRIWVTRTEPEASATAARLTAMGHVAVVAPVLQAQPIAQVIDLAGTDAIAFTSGHALAMFALLSPERDIPVFTVGAATALRATEAGFHNVRSADGDAAALANLIAQAKPALVLHPSAREPAAHLTALLAAHAVTARAVPVYETVPTALTTAPQPIDAILIHSARAAAGVAALQPPRDTPIFAISAAAAWPLAAAGYTRITAAPFPNEAALLDLLK